MGNCCSGCDIPNLNALEGNINFEWNGVKLDGLFHKCHFVGNIRFHLQSIGFDGTISYNNRDRYSWISLILKGIFTFCDHKMEGKAFIQYMQPLYFGKFRCFDYINDIKTEEGNYINGHKDGLSIVKYKDGRIKILRYENGVVAESRDFLGVNKISPNNKSKNIQTIKFVRLDPVCNDDLDIEGETM